MNKHIDPYWYINDMEVHTDTAPHIYANGLQQVKLTLGVKALDGRGTEVVLTQSEKTTCRLSCTVMPARFFLLMNLMRWAGLCPVSTQAMNISR